MGTQFDSRKQRELAYRLWEERGRPEGPRRRGLVRSRAAVAVRSARAESAAVDEAARESFPASDPPSSHVPDKPPVNAKKRKARRRAAADRASARAERPLQSSSYRVTRVAVTAPATPPRGRLKMHGEHLVGLAHAVVDDRDQHALDRCPGRKRDRLAAESA